MSPTLAFTEVKSAMFPAIPKNRATKAPNDDSNNRESQAIKHLEQKLEEARSERARLLAMQQQETDIPGCI